MTEERVQREDDPGTAATFPGPKGRPLTGNLREFQKERLSFFARCLERYGRFVAFRVGNKPALLVADADAIDDVLAKRTDVFERIPHYRANRMLFGEGLFRSTGDLWRRQHAIVDPLLTHERVIDSYLPAMLDSAARGLAGWRGGEVVDAVEALLPVSLDAAVAAIWGVDLPANGDELRCAVRRAYDGFDRRLDALIPTSIGIPTPRNLRLKKDIRAVDAFVLEQIRSRRAGGEGRDVLSRLARATDERGDPMPDERIRDEVVSFVQAAYRPTPVALAWAWYLLAEHPEVEEELHRELDTELHGELRAADVDRLAFARMVMLETLRLYSPVHMTGRVPNADTEIAGRPVRKGTTALLLNHTMHHDAAFFEDPGSFRPRRWEDGLASSLPRFAYFPFSGGPRGCIGEDLATTEMIALLALVGRRFRVRPEREVEPRGGFLLVPDGGMPVRLEARG